jgi:hypothetical protein
MSLDCKPSLVPTKEIRNKRKTLVQTRNSTKRVKLADEAKAIEDAKRILFRNVLMEAYQQEI